MKKDREPRQVKKGQVKTRGNWDVSGDNWDGSDSDLMARLKVNAAPKLAALAKSTSNDDTRKKNL